MKKQNEEATVYRVQFTREWRTAEMRKAGSKPAVVTQERTFTKEKLHELIGRWTLKYGPPIDMETAAPPGVTTYEYYKRDETGYQSMTLRFFKTAGQSFNKPITTEVKKTEPEVIETLDPKLSLLVSQGLLTKVS